jgi:hypothetical protein
MRCTQVAADHAGYGLTRTMELAGRPEDPDPSLNPVYLSLAVRKNSAVHHCASRLKLAHRRRLTFLVNCCLLILSMCFAV